MEKNNFNKIKKRKVVTRIGIVETNSSSTHSLVISMSDESLVKRGDADFNLEITEDNKLYVPQLNRDFGWDYSKDNDCLSKLLYASGLIYSKAGFGEYSDNANYKIIKSFKTKLKNYLNVDDVIFQWDLDYEKEVMEFEERYKNDVYDDSPWGYKGPILLYPSVDHQSNSDSYEQVFENIDTLIHFIFSRDSWLYGGNDNSEEPENFMSECIIPPEKKYRHPFTVTIKFSHNGIDKSGIGDVDLEFENDYGFYWQGANILYGIRWDILNSKIVLNSPSQKRIGTREETNRHIFNNREILDETKYLSVPKIGVGENGEFYFYLIKDSIYERLRNKRNENYELMSNIYQTLVKDYKFGEDYISFPTVIVSSEFGEFNSKVYKK